ncbi:MAG: hypothetical protein GXO99_02640 [Nitrospirae bacterium]|nr:hypothetical protein [Nitrospirota bacterium]
MNGGTVESFFKEVIASIEKHFSDYQLEILFKTPKSLKANIHFGQNLFIAVRYNARNERIDFALIYKNQRVFGYDNLKEWHYHPFNNPSIHIPCKEPSIDRIISEIKEICSKIKKQRG